MEWSETHASVPVVRGNFNVILGSVSNLESVFDEPDRFVSVSIDDGSDISPRQQILSAPFALTAGHAATATVADSLSGGAAQLSEGEPSSDGLTNNGVELVDSEVPPVTIEVTRARPVFATLGGTTDASAIQADPSTIGDFWLVIEELDENGDPTPISPFARGRIQGAKVPPSSLSGTKLLQPGSYRFSLQLRRASGGGSGDVRVGTGVFMVVVQL